VAAKEHSDTDSRPSDGRMNGRVDRLQRPCLDALQKLKFFTLSVTSIFRPMHKVVNVGKKITNYTV
jgi:hypothetical protein